MFSSIRSVCVLTLVAAVIWGCGGDRVTTPQAPGAEDAMARPLAVR